MNRPDHPLTPRQTAFLERLNESHLRLLNAIDRLDEETISSHRVIDEWTVKDILGHIVSWNREFRREIEIILQGRHPGVEYQIVEDDEYQDWNQQQAARKKKWTWEQILADLELDHQEAQELVERLQPSEFSQRGVTAWSEAAVVKPETITRQDTESVETLVTFHWRHANQHVNEILKWRKNLNTIPLENS